MTGVQTCALPIYGGVGTGWFDQGWTRLGSSHGERGGSRAEGWSEVKPEVWIVLIAGALHQEQLVGLEAGYESTGRKKGLVTRDSEGNVLMRSFWGINFIIFRFWNLCIFPRTLFRKKKNSINLSYYKTKLISQKNFFLLKEHGLYIFSWHFFSSPRRSTLQ